MTLHARSGPVLALGGIGGDAHTVGLTVLRQALQSEGYQLVYMGPQNDLRDFFDHASSSNAVLISTSDGHARHYLREFPALLHQYRAYNTLWYLGGNLCIDDGHGLQRHFMGMGFHRVFTKFVDLNEVLRLLRMDLQGVRRAGMHPARFDAGLSERARVSQAVSDERIPEGLFVRQRQDVLQQWPTGKGARCLDENAAALVERPSFAQAQTEVLARGASVLVQPRCGVSSPREQLRIFESLMACGVRVLSFQVDSLTRNNNHEAVAEVLRRGAIESQTGLNGFPAVNHGVSTLRSITRAVGVPLQVRHSTRDPRLLAEISFASGITAFEGGGICYNVPYYKNLSLDESIQTWQYVDRLAGIYRERYGIVLDREFFGTLTATLVPPCLAIVVNVLESILALQQGVRCLSLGYAEQGNRVQDVAAVRALESITRDVVVKLGYRDVQINTVFHQYMAAFPPQRERAIELIYESAITASLARATRIITKTCVESIKIPSLEDNLEGLFHVRRGLADAACVHVDESLVEAEYQIIHREVSAILNEVLSLGGGCVAKGIVKGFLHGCLDIPFSASAYNNGEVLTARDNEGAVRFLSIGNLPFDRDLCDFHREKMQERYRKEGLSSGSRYILVEQDVLQVPRGEYERWPL